MPAARRFSSHHPEHPKILITGGLGQLGRALAGALRGKYGRESVILSDIKKPEPSVLQEGPYVYGDICDAKHLHSVVVDHAVDWVVNYSALLSAAAENNVLQALEVNTVGFHNVLEVCRAHSLRLFCPSTIGAFGPTSERNPTPDITIQRPAYIYGITKVYMEILGEYYHRRFGLDFRCLRYPGIISAGNPGGGTTDYAVDIFHEAAQRKQYSCFLRSDTRLPMMYLSDCLRATVQFLEASPEQLKQRTYNVTGMSFTPEEIFKEIKKFYPDLEVLYHPDSRQDIADSWPMEIGRAHV